MSKDKANDIRHTPFGLIPEDWEFRALFDICEMIQDGTHFSPTSKGGTYRYVTSKNIRFGKMDLSECEYISEEEHKQIYQRCPVKTGDVLLTKDGAKTGNAALNILNEPFSLLSSVVVVRAKPHIASNKYLLQTILSPRMQYIIKDSMAGQAITRLTLTTIKGLHIPLPKIDEQHKIAAILGSWDTTIEHTEKLIAAKVKRKRGLMQQLLTGKKRFQEFGNTKWATQTLGYFFKEFSSLNKANEDLPIFSCTKTKGIVLQLERFGRRLASAEIKRYKVVEHGDLIYDPMLLWDASIGFLERTERGVISPAYFTFKFDESKGSRSYFKHLFDGYYMRQQYKLVSRGTNVRRQKAPKEDFLNIVVDVPELHEQRRIAAVLEKCDKEIELLQKQLRALKRQKQGLMQKLLTGQIRVKVAQEAAS